MHYMYIHICIHLYIRCSTILCFSVGVGRSTSEVRTNALHVHTYMYTSVYTLQHYTMFFCSFAYMYVAAHSLMKRKQVDREELERRDQLKQLRSEAEQMVCSFTGEHFNWSS